LNELLQFRYGVHACGKVRWSVSLFRVNADIAHAFNHGAELYQ
jgi:hypothetical protein